MERNVTQFERNAPMEPVITGNGRAKHLNKHEKLLNEGEMKERIGCALESPNRHAVYQYLLNNTGQGTPQTHGNVKTKKARMAPS